MSSFNQGNASTRTNLTNRPTCLLWFALFWTGFASIFVYVGLSADGGAPFTIIGGLFVLIGLGLLAYALLSFYTRYQVGEPDVDISTMTLAVGEPVEVNLTHRFPRSVEINQIHLQLVFRETATYQQGTDTRTVTHEQIIDETEIPAGRFNSGATLRKTVRWQIPINSMHTVKVRRNQLQWLVRFKMDVPRLPNYAREFELDVLPQVK